MSDNTQPNYLNKKQSQWVYDTVVGTKEHYGTPGTFAFACLAAVLSIGPKGLHIKSIEGLHIGCKSARSDKHMSQAYGHQGNQQVPQDGWWRSCTPTCDGGLRSWRTTSSLAPCTKTRQHRNIMFHPSPLPVGGIVRFDPVERQHIRVTIL